MPSSGVSREVRSAAASWNQYKARLQAIPCKWMKGRVIGFVIASSRNARTDVIPGGKASLVGPCFGDAPEATFRVSAQEVRVNTNEQIKADFRVVICQRGRILSGSPTIQEMGD
jgi:hypothetical protein